MRAYICIYTDIFNLPHPCKETGLWKAGAGCGNKQLGREGAVGTLILSTWDVEGSLLWGRMGTETLMPPPAALHPSSGCFTPCWPSPGKYEPLARRCHACPACTSPCLHLALPDAACWAESPGARLKLAERRKPFKITFFPLASLDFFFFFLSFSLLLRIPHSSAQRI